MAAAHDVPEAAERVEAGEARRREAPAARVEPERRGAGQHADAVALPHRVPVAQPLGVVPHPVGVDDPAAGALGDAEHPPVDVGGHPGDHPRRRPAEPLGPRPANEVVVAADAAARDDDGLGGDLEVADLGAAARPPALDVVVLEHGAAHPGDDAAGLDEGVDAVPEGEGHQAPGHALADPSLEGRDDAGTGAPREVEARHRVAVAVGAPVAPLGPADDGEEPVPLLVEPGPLLPGREVEVGLGPLARPEVLLPVELRRSEPVLPGQLEAVGDPHPSLLRAADEEEPAEAPPGLAADRLLALLVDEHDAPSGVDELSGGDEPGQAGSDDDDVGLHGSLPVGHGTRRVCRGARPASPPGRRGSTVPDDRRCVTTA